MELSLITTKNFVNDISQLELRKNIKTRVNQYFKKFSVNLGITVGTKPLPGVE